MEKVLERALEKFDIFQRKLIEGNCPIMDSNSLIDFAGQMTNYCKEGNSFEVWYDDCIKYSMNTFKLILEKDEVLTKEELRIYYEHTRDNYLKNFKEYKRLV